MFSNGIENEISGIYYILNIITNKIYIGQSKNIRNRWYRHRKEHKYRKSNIYASMRKHGFEKFRFGILLKCNIDELNKWEKFYITIFDSVQNGYNLTYGGDSCIMSIETRNKISKSKMGMLHSVETKTKMSNDRRGANHPLYGKQHSKATVDKIKDTIRKSYEEGYVSPTCKKVRYLNKEFQSLTILANSLNLTRGQLYRRIESNKIEVSFI